MCKQRQVGKGVGRMKKIEKGEKCFAIGRYITPFIFFFLFEEQTLRLRNSIKRRFAAQHAMRLNMLLPSSRPTGTTERRRVRDRNLASYKKRVKHKESEDQRAALQKRDAVLLKCRPLTMKSELTAGCFLIACGCVMCTLLFKIIMFSI